MSARMTALVTGAAGAIGPELVRYLLAQGYDVRAIVHQPVPPGLLPDPVVVFRGDICDRQLAQEAASNVSAVFHLAARLHDPNPRPDARPEYERINVNGTGTLLEAAEVAGAERFVFFSTVSVYGPTGSKLVDEEHPPSADTYYAATKLSAEKLVLASRMGVVLRMAAVYGPHMKGNFVSLARALERRRFVPIGQGTNLRTLIYSADAVRAAVLASQHPSATRKIYNVSDGTVHTVSEIVDAICGALGRTAPRVAVPIAAARLAAGATDAILAGLGRPRRFGQAVEKLTETVAVESRRIQAELGFQPEFDLQNGWLATIDSWRARRWSRCS